jgi:hypothetical protein
MRGSAAGVGVEPHEGVHSGPAHPGRRHRPNRHESTRQPTQSTLLLGAFTEVSSREPHL